ncbi:LOW QUALITY PROTEIN: DNA ligase 4-like [Babylonia areolata]|uniref:LOW QUALITY PROTEIN: DNA ligase 4-like n=1 Tax=Babylonia areolata TaxID=304850 RepID=UPI003FD3C8AD
MAEASSPGNVTVAGKVAFAELCGLLEKLSKTKGNDKKKRVLRDFVETWRRLHTETHTADADTTTDSFYPAMRLLLPHLERERVAYGIKENGLARLMIKVLCLGKESADAQRLLNYRAVKTARGDAGDFASMAYFVLKTRCPERGSLTIQQVNETLDSIASNNAAKKKTAVEDSILYLLKNLSALEQKWLVRMIVKELKVGLSQASVLSVYHTDAEDFFNVNNNLEKVCLLLRDPATRMHEIGISVFSPFTPMLGDRASPDKIEKLMEGRPYLIETKLDGERVLLHKKGDEYKYFSRSGNEYTSVFGATPFDGTLTPYIANCFQPEVDTCIIDGEMLGYHAASKTFGTKGEQFDIKSRDVAEAKGYQPCVVVFDVLLYNGRVLTNLPLRERLTYLDKVVIPVEGRIQISRHREARTNQDCVDALNDAIDGREEGIMVKDPQTAYRPNTRKGGWYKIKPEYVGGLMDELDLLIVGGYFGEGHRGGMMSHFMCGVAVPTEDGSDPEVFHSFCKVGSGYSKKQLAEFNQRLADHWQPFDKRNPPQCLILAPGFRERPDAWIKPDKSCIVQVKAAEIIQSEKFKVGYTLRFPRVEMIRDDKPWTQCMTTADVEDLRLKSGGKLAGGRMELGEGEEGEEVGGGPSKKKRRVAPRAVQPKLMSRFKGADVSDVEQVSQVLSGKEVCVMNGPADLTKPQIERKVVEMGAKFVQNPGSTTSFVLAEKIAIKVNNLIKTDKYDIVRVSWFRRLLEAGCWIPWTPGDMIHTSPATRRQFQRDYDDYGDSFTDDVTEEQLRHIFSSMDKDEDIVIPPVSSDAIAELEEEHFADESPYGLFRTCRMYMDSNLVVGDESTHLPTSSLDLLALELRFFGATVVSQLDSQVSHVVVEESDLSRLDQLKAVRRGRQKKFRIVTKKWIKACMEEGGLCAEKTFEL